MPLKIVKGKNLPIGADLGSSSVKLAQLRSSQGQYELLAADAREIPRECRTDQEQRLAFMADAVRAMQKGKTFWGRRCILSIPADVTVVQHVKMPRMKSELLPDALRAELEGKLPFGGGEAIVRHLLAGTIYLEGKEMQERIVVAVSRGAKRTVRLDVVGAFHSPFMASAAEKLKDELKNTEIKPPAIPIFSNVTGKALPDSADGIREILVKQVTSRVLWVDCVKNMIAGGAADFLEIGPGKVITGLLRRIDRSARCGHVCSVEDLEAVGK